MSVGIGVGGELDGDEVVVSKTLLSLPSLLLLLATIVTMIAITARKTMKHPIYMASLFRRSCEFSCFLVANTVALGRLSRYSASNSSGVTAVSIWITSLSSLSPAPPTPDVPAA